MIVSLLLTFAAAFVLALGLTYAVRAAARRVGLVDRPDGDRHGHDLAIPRAGGAAVYVATAVVLGLLVLAGGAGLEAAGAAPLAALGAGATAVFLLGLVDDVRGLRARVKFVAEAAIALAVFAAGVRIEGIGLPGGGALEFPFWASAVLTTLWIVGITNAFNLIDGSDGVAAGAALFASATIATVSLLAGQELGAVLGLALAGATLAFLFFNFPPASIFLGDSGSLFLGFTLATLGIMTTQKAQTALAIAIPVVSFGVPILDTLLAVARRFLRGEPIFRPDRGHIHHRLRDLGHSPRKVALLLYALCAAFALLSLLLVQSPDSAALIVPVVGGAAMWLIVQRLRIPELLEVRRAVGRGLRQRSVIAHNVRIREAAARMQAAAEPEELLHALTHAFDGGEFERVELWLEPAGGAVLRECAGVERRGAGYTWSYHTNGDGTDGLWGVQLPFIGDDGVAARAAGHLALWRGRAAEHLLTDLRLIALDLQPALRDALARLAVRPAPALAAVANGAWRPPAHRPAVRAVDGARRG